ncbi:MAG: adenylate cyclase class 2 [Pirellulaceae bacterium]|jgi:adenylate cyclase class 2
MKYEVEQKYPVPDVAKLEADLQELGVTLDAAIVQVDRYFAHPQRDFRETDEALRIRSVGDKNRITYKGPKIDKETKTRREIELSLQSGTESAEELSELLTILGFRSVASVTKRRRRGELQYEGRGVEISVDDVEQVGDFVELELVTDAEGIAAAKKVVLSLADKLELKEPQLRGYLDLLLDGG